MKSFLFSILSVVLAATAAQAQSSENQLVTDKNGNAMLLGKCPRTALLDSPFVTWFSSQYDQYLVDSTTCRFIRPLLTDKAITIFMGTWCGDSRREVPRMLKMLDCCGFPESSLTVIMVSNADTAYKKSPGHEEEGRNIVRVPTLIVQDKEREVGRIVEYPRVSLEKDLLAILQKQE